MLTKRRKRDTEKDQPFGLTGIVGMKVAVDEKAMRGWRQPLTETEPPKDGKEAPGQAKGDTKGKNIHKVEV